MPLVYLAVTQGGWTALQIPAYAWVLMPLLDTNLGCNLRNPDTNTPEAALFWFRLLTWIWFPIQFVLVFGTLWYLIHIGSYSVMEPLGIMFGIGVTTGTVGIVYADELMHKPQKFERNFADLLLALVLYGHFRIEHLLVHHPHVGTPRDTVTARYNEDFMRPLCGFWRQGWARRGGPSGRGQGAARGIHATRVGNMRRCNLAFWRWRLPLVVGARFVCLSSKLLWPPSNWN